MNEHSIKLLHYILNDVFVITKTLIFDEKCFCSQSEIELSIDNENVVFSSCGVSKVKQDSIKFCKYELLERVLAFYLINPNKTFISIPYFSTITEVYNCKQILLSSKKTLNVHDINANGLSFSKNLKYSINHSTLEIIEKEINSLLWYENKLFLQIEKIEERFFKGLQYNIISYSLANLNIPYSITILFAKDFSTFVCGTSLKCNLSEAINKSKIEAFTMFDNTLISKKIISENFHRMKRYNSLFDKSLNKIRVEMLTLKTTLNKDKKQTKSVSSIVKIYLKFTQRNTNDITLFSLLDNSNYYLTRVVLHNYNDRRYNYNDQIPIDPFC